MTVSVHLWSYFRDLAGTAELKVELPDAASVADLLDAVYRQHPKLGALRNSTLIAVGVDYQIRETFESALQFGAATLETLGIDRAEVGDVIADVRRRDAERLELQMSGGRQAGRKLMKGNIPEPVPTPLAPPRRRGEAMNEGAADALKPPTTRVN